MCEVGRVHIFIVASEWWDSLIPDTMRATLKDLIEDVSALSSPEYLESIEEARNDYREGRVK
jgi:hypothetical protein